MINRSVVLLGCGSGTDQIRKSKYTLGTVTLPLLLGKGGSLTRRPFTVLGESIIDIIAREPLNMGEDLDCMSPAPDRPGMRRTRTPWF